MVFLILAFIDGQIQELDKPFKVAGKQALYPGEFGDPSEDCNCRCCLLQRAKWAISKEEYITKFNGDTNELVTMKSDSFAKFKTEYMDLMENSKDNEFIYTIPDAGFISIKAPKVADSKYPIYADMSVDEKTIKFYENKIEQVVKGLPEDFVMPERIILASMGENIAGGYMQSTDNLFLNSLLDTDKKLLAFVNKNSGYFANTTANGPLLHELGHKYHYTLIENLAKSKNIEYNVAKEMFDKGIKEYIDNNNIDIENLLSRYAAYTYYKGDSINEIMAEYFSVVKNEEKTNLLIDSITQIIKKER